MNCKICNAELKEGAVFCQECGAKVEDDLTQSTLKCLKCGAKLEPDIKFCSQCGAAAADNLTKNTECNLAEINDGIAENNVLIQQNNDLIKKAKLKINKNPKYFGALGVVALILVVSTSISLSISGSRKKPAETSTYGNSSYGSSSGGSSSKYGSSYGSSSGSSSSKYGSSSSSGALSEDLKKIIVESALLSEVKRKYPIADAGSTRYKINTTERKNGYTIVYGKLYLYDKYGKSTTGHSDGSGSSIRTFEVKINNSTNKVSSCTIK